MIIAEATAAANAVEYQHKDDKLSLSEHAVDVAADCWKFTLNWVGSHTFSFVAFLVFLGWLAYVNVGNGVRRRARKDEYRDRRHSAREANGATPPTSTTNQEPEE